MQNKSNPSQGFSLTEIMVACLALGIMLIPVFMMFSQGTAGTTKNRNDILAQQHASNLLAYATSLNYDDAFLKAGLQEVKEKKVNSSDGTEIDLSISEEIFKRTMEIKEYTFPDFTNAYKLITVSVKWSQAGEKANDTKKEIKISGLLNK
ncbi:MAG: hypothetical protein PHQ02_06525 [Candidatus Riflebacteria bacterium]|nr:hypothetical protein [Candidatus Riflebacteria bacterium]